MRPSQRTNAAIAIELEGGSRESDQENKTLLLGNAGGSSARVHHLIRSTGPHALCETRFAGYPSRQHRHLPILRTSGNRSHAQWKLAQRTQYQDDKR